MHWSRMHFGFRKELNQTQRAFGSKIQKLFKNEKTNPTSLNIH